MRLYYITFRSVTFAQRGERLLTDAGFSCSLGRSPRWMEEQGCGYALRLRTNDIKRAADLLRSSRIPLRRFYVQREDGILEEAEV